MQWMGVSCFMSAKIPLALGGVLLYNNRRFEKAYMSARGEAGYRSGFRFQRPGVRIPPGGPKKRASTARLVLSFSVRGDSNPERVSAVKKTVQWTVFRHEVRRGYAARTQGARQSRSDCIPPGGPKKRASTARLVLSFSVRGDSNPERVSEKPPLA